MLATNRRRVFIISVLSIGTDFSSLKFNAVTYLFISAEVLVYITTCFIR